MKAVRVFVKSVKVHVKAVRVLVEAVRVLVEAVRVLVEAVRVLYSISIYSKNFGTKPKLVDVFLAKAKRFYLFQNFWKQNQNYFDVFQLFLAKAKRFSLIQKHRNNTKTF